MRESIWEHDPRNFQCTMHDSGVQGNLVGLTFDDGMLRLNAKLNNLIHFVEKYRNVNALNSNHVVCVSCEDYHIDYQYKQA